VPETLFGHLNSNGTVSGGIPIPGLASILSDPADGTSTVIEGLDSFPADSRPTTRQVNAVHLAWDVMVGIATMLFLLSGWYGVTWLFRRRLPKTKWFLRAAAVAGIASIICMEAGWVVTEVGRQPWIVRNYLKVQDAATTNGGVWATFLVVLGIYLTVGVTTILILRGMSKRWREAAAPTDDEDGGGPYGPRPLEDATVG